MMKKLMASVFTVALMFQAQAHADTRPIDVPVLNGFFAALATQVLEATRKAEDQTQPALLNSLDVKLEPSSSFDRDKEKFQIDALANVSRTKWDAAAPSTFSATANLRMGEDGLVGVDLRAGVDTDAAALFRYLTSNYELLVSPGEEDSPELTAFKQVAQPEYEKIKTATDTQSVLDALQKITEAHLVYIEAGLNSAAPDSEEALYLELLKKVETPILAALAAPGRTDSVLISFTEQFYVEQLNVQSIDLAISPKEVKLRLVADTDQTVEVQMLLAGLETLSSAASLDEGTPARVEAEDEVRTILKDFVDAAKSFALE